MFLNKKAWRFGAAFLFIILCSLIFSFVGQDHYLQVYDENEQRVIWETPIKENETFYHEYFHSVSLTPVREYYRMDDEGNMVATESWVQSFGAGIPYEKKDKLLFIDGFYVLQAERKVEELTLLPSDLYSHHFYFQEDQLDLTAFAGHKLRIRIVRQ